MKQLLSLSLFLFILPCLAWAQYPSNGNQKITLGEQTTADGLVYRGVASTDTVRKPSIDTMAYMVLDTTTNIMWHYKKATSNAWLRLNLLPSDTASIAYVNTYGTQTVNGAKTFTSALTATRFNPTATTVTGNGMYLPATNTLGFSTNGTNRMTILSTGAVGIGTTTPKFYDGYSTLTIGSPTNNGGIIAFSSSYNSGDGGELYQNTSGDYFFNNNSSTTSLIMKVNSEVFMGYNLGDDKGAYRLQVKDSVYVGGNVSASAYTTRSDYNLKDDIFDIKYGLNDVLQLQPVEYTYKSNGSKQLGFIAQDIGTILPEVVSFEESMSVNYQAIIPILTKAIQEQQALIKALEQRIINLENK
jgi:hypothetical protein